MFHWFQRGWNTILEALFPKRCLQCGAYGTYACAACFSSLTFQRCLKCPNCGQPNAMGEFCPACSDSHQLNGLWCGLNYAQPLLRQLIRAFKYDNLQDIGDILNRLLLATLLTYQLPPAWHNIPVNDWRVTPVPLFKRKLRQRGFNQAANLAQAVAQNKGLLYQDCLIRRRATRPQSKLNNQQRLSNLRQAFALSPNAIIKPGCYILVDDVFTTGATLEQCAAVLKQAGAKEVWGLTVAKG